MHPEATIIFGASFDDELDDTIRVSVICTGLRAGNFEDPAHHAKKTAFQKDAEQKQQASQSGGFFSFLKLNW